MLFTENWATLLRSQLLQSPDGSGRGTTSTLQEFTERLGAPRGRTRSNAENFRVSKHVY